MGNCINGNSQVTMKVEESKTISRNTARPSRKTADPIPTYPSIEDVLNNNYRRRRGNK